jgi:hypothetical protein
MSVSHLTSASAREREAQGLPARVTDPTALRRVAALLRRAEERPATRREVAA